jgi:3-oxoacyl-[acyl-carrier protein] reductase
MNKVAVVTGSSKGIGAATVLAFAGAGYDVVVNYHKDKAAADGVAAKARDAGAGVLAVKADVFTEEGVHTLFDAIKDRYGRIDVLVNNAGVAEEPAFEDLNAALITEALAANFTSAVLCTKAALPLMKAGSILYCSSVYGLDQGGNPGLPLYSAAKAAVKNFTQTMAEKLGPDIRCNAVAPGVTRTQAWDTASPEYIAARKGMSLQDEWVRPEEVAAAFVFLAQTPHLNAETIVVDAGYMKKFPPRNR